MICITYQRKEHQLKNAFGWSQLLDMQSVYFDVAAVDLITENYEVKYFVIGD
jgi:hypothetical protein